jgi:hypothetical protein
MARLISSFETADGRRFKSEAEAVRHERLLEMAEAADGLHDLMIDVLFDSPDVQRALDCGEVEFGFVSRLAAWMVSEPARTAVGEVLRMVEEGIPRSGRDPEEQDGTG